MKGIQMNWDQIEGNWKQFKGNVKQQWGKITDDHLRARFRKPMASQKKMRRSNLTNGRKSKRIDCRTK
jgi:hypothetical protein